MDLKSLQMLEFPKVREILAGFTSFAASHELALELAPSADAETIIERLGQSGEARALLAQNESFTIGGVRDIRQTVDMAAKGKILDPSNLLEIATTLEAIDRLHANISHADLEMPRLRSIAEGIVSFPQIKGQILRCIDDAAEIRDEASPKLSEIRRGSKESRNKLLGQLDRILKSSVNQETIQEAIITEREGRYVIPIKTEFQHVFKGIIHDVSNTGATVFIEPFKTVELGNRIRQLQMEEEHEIQRILANLSAEVRAKSTEISQTIALVAEIDLALAKARYALKANAVEPMIVTDPEQHNFGVLKLVKACHPLLPGDAVPLSLEIGRDFSELIITGPNTGGKTVALKTIGLMALMTQAGMPISASEESVIPVFDGVFADIGDEQSIEQTLSTFSWHVGNIVRILRISTTSSLVLLDELGSATDPAEGTALARAILIEFLKHKTLTVATTHFSELKIFAHATPGIQNASFEFDPVTLAPTYHLMMGVPGGSNALSIASQLGLPTEIVETARGMLAEGASDIEDMLQDLAAEKQSARIERGQLQQEHEELTILRENLQQEQERLKDEEVRLLKATTESLSREAAALHKQIREASAELKKTKSKEVIEASKKTLKSVREELAAPVWQPQIDDIATATGDSDIITVGDQVRMIDTGVSGTVTAISDKTDQVEIDAGQTRIKVNLKEVKKLPEIQDSLKTKGYSISRSQSKVRPQFELDLRGKRAEAIEPEVDTYLNNASLSGIGQGRIIHGFGTGVVRKIVRDMLVRHPLVKSFRPGEEGEGGDGVTVVTF